MLEPCVCVCVCGESLRSRGRAGLTCGQWRQLTWRGPGNNHATPRGVARLGEFPYSVTGRHACGPPPSICLLPPPFVSPSPLRTPPEGDVCERGLHHRPGKLGPATG